MGVLPHPIEGFEECLVCHGFDGPVPYPENHQDFSTDICLVCHGLEDTEPLTAPGFIAHSIVERERCSECHQVDLLPATHQEQAFSDRQCVTCHLVR
jgi:hypothetical protein